MFNVLLDQNMGILFNVIPAFGVYYSWTVLSLRGLTGLGEYIRLSKKIFVWRWRYNGLS